MQGERGLQGVQGERGLQGVQGEQGPQGDTGPAGPNLIASGVVSSNGTVFAIQGPSPTVTHPGPGQYGITIALGTHCPIPTLTPYQNSDVISWGYGGGCGGGTFTSEVRTSSGTDQAFSYHFLGVQPAAAARSAKGGDWQEFTAPE